MASDNETHAEIVATFRERCDGPFMADVNGFVVDFKSQEGLTFADRLEAAHRREVAELREFLHEAICSSCAKCTLHNSRLGQCSYSSGACNDVYKWSKALKGSNDEGK